MQDLDEWRAYVVHLRAEHGRLDELVREIQCRLSDVSADPVKSHSHDQLQSQFQTLRIELARHFSEEEQGGCIEEAVARRPTLAAEARQIESEHPQLLEHLDHLIERTPTLTLDLIKAEFDDFAKGLLRHESLENRIVERGFNVSPE